VIVTDVAVVSEGQAEDLPETEPPTEGKAP
jgi:hypothetical protein